jgi:hypothetical protein
MFSKFVKEQTVKKIIGMLVIALMTCTVAAQQQTLINEKIESGGYGGPVLSVGQINGQSGVFMGGQGGWIINHRLVIGGLGYGLVNNVTVEGVQNLIMNFGCGGALIEYIVASDRLVHASIQSMIGAGGVRYDVKDYKYDHDKPDYSEDAFFVLEPGANLILNVSKNFRIGAGVSYRYVNGVDYKTLTDSDLSGVSAKVFMKFGTF